MKWDLTDPPQFAFVDGNHRSAQSLQLQLSAVRHSEMQTASGYSLALVLHAAAPCPSPTRSSAF